MQSSNELLEQVRSHAAALERARIARELHDGIIQVMLGVQIQLAALRPQVAEQLPGVASELKRLDGILQREVVSLRELMQGMTPIDLEPDQLVEALSEVVQRFERETGIHARFVTQLNDVALESRTCCEIVRIVQEALVNVRKHSAARHVLVRFGVLNGSYVVSVEDDGCGFPFAGRKSPSAGGASRQSPRVIRERVRLIGGRLSIESEPGQGARVEIAIPRSNHGIH